MFFLFCFGWLVEGFFQGPLLNVVLVFRFVESCEIILLQVVPDEKKIKGEKGGKEKRRKKKLKTRIKAKRKGRSKRKQSRISV